MIQGQVRWLSFQRKQNPKTVPSSKIGRSKNGKYFVSLKPLARHSGRLASKVCDMLTNQRFFVAKKRSSDSLWDKRSDRSVEINHCLSKSCFRISSSPHMATGRPPDNERLNSFSQVEEDVGEGMRLFPWEDILGMMWWE